MASHALANLDDLPEEILDLICGHARQASILPSKSDIRTLYSRRMFFTSAPAPTSLAALRLVSRRFFRLATPYLWQSLDLEIIDSDVSAAKRSRNSVLALDFIATNKHVAQLVKYVNLDLRSFIFNFGAEALPMIQLENSLRKFIPALSAVISFHCTNFECLPSSAARSFLASPSLRMLVLNPPSSSEARDKYMKAFRDVDLSHLEAFGWNDHSCADVRSFFDFPLQFKRVMLFSQWLPTDTGEVKETFDNAWVSTVEELVVSEWTGSLAPIVSNHYEVRSTIYVWWLTVDYFPYYILHREHRPNTKQCRSRNCC